MSKVRVSSEFDRTADFVLYEGNCLDLLPHIPDEFFKLVVTSPPYNLGKPYESRLDMNEYLAQQREVIEECVRVLDDRGSICWQVGNYVDSGEIIPLDILLYPIFASLGLHLRNRIVWHFGHGLHASKRFSGRYEVILWFTKGKEYTFNLDAVRVPQKYPKKKYFKGPKKGQLSGNPLGKNPSDIWEIPNVKANHVEKTIHPCQFPVELIERLVLSMTDEGDWVLDPFIGVGTTGIAALMHNRKAIGAEILPEYVEVAKERIHLAGKGALRIRPMERSVYDPNAPGKSVPPKFVNLGASPIQPQLLDQRVHYTTQEQEERIVYEYSHLGGAEILQVRYPDIDREIREVVSEITAKRTKISKEKTKRGKALYSPSDMNRQFKEAFEDRGYRELRHSYELTIPNSDFTISGTFKQIDFVKDKVLIEVQLGKYFAMFYDIAKFQYFYNENKAEVGVEIVPCHALYREMSSGVSYGEKLVYDIEQMRRHFPAAPVKVILIDVDESN